MTQKTETIELTDEFIQLFINYGQGEELTISNDRIFQGIDDNENNSSFFFFFLVNQNSIFQIINVDMKYQIIIIPNFSSSFFPFN